jgi:hypothetical protein
MPYCTHSCVLTDYRTQNIHCDTQCSRCNFTEACIKYNSQEKSKSLATRHGDAWRKRRYSSYSFLTSALYGGSGQCHAPAALCPWKRTPGTHWTGGWVGLRAGLDTEARGKILFPGLGSKPDRPVVQSVVRHYTD